MDESTDSEDTHRFPPRATNHFLFPPSNTARSDSASSTPLPSRSTSPLPQFYPQSESWTSDSDSEEHDHAPFLHAHNHNHPPSPTPTNTNPRHNIPAASAAGYPWWKRKQGRRPWWALAVPAAPVRRREERRPWRPLRLTRRWLRRLVRHPFFPSQPITIVLTLILFSIFAISLTLLLMYVLNPDKEPLPWRAYCSVPALVPPFDKPLPPGSPHIFPNYTYTPSSSSASANTTPLQIQVPPFPHAELDTLPPAGVLVGVFSIASSFERRMLVRSTWASHPRSRDGAGEGDAGRGTSRTVVRFVLGQPSKNWERRVRLEMEIYNDIIILPIAENMNNGKSHTFFSWAAINAWVPPVYREIFAAPSPYSNVTTSVPQARFSYSNATAAAPGKLAPHDPWFAWRDLVGGSGGGAGEGTERKTEKTQQQQPQPWVRPDFVVKVDDDSFVMLAELEARLRLELYDQTRSDRRPASAGGSQHEAGSAQPPSTAPSKSLLPSSSSNTNTNTDPLIYYGYLVTNRLHIFMAGELYALSFALVDWAARDPTVSTMTWGAEDKQTAKWMRMHPRREEVRWTSERCWIYDHPRSGTVYSHGYLFPSEVTRVKRDMLASLERSQSQQALQALSPGVLNANINANGNTNTPAQAFWGHSSVSTFGQRYAPPLPDLSPKHSVEALVEGSEMSMLREGSAMTPDYAWTHREGRRARYEGQRVGGTVVVHFIKKNMWYLETALAMLEGEEESEAERYEAGRRMDVEGEGEDDARLAHARANMRGQVRAGLRLPRLH